MTTEISLLLMLLVSWRAVKTTWFCRFALGSSQAECLLCASSPPRTQAEVAASTWYMLFYGESWRKKEMTWCFLKLLHWNLITSIHIPLVKDSHVTKSRVNGMKIYALPVGPEWMLGTSNPTDHIYLLSLGIQRAENKFLTSILGLSLILCGAFFTMPLLTPEHLS